MDRDSFLEGVKNQFTSEITALYLKYEHNGKVDHPELTKELKSLEKQARVEGINSREFADLVRSCLPAADSEKTGWTKKAA